MEDILLNGHIFKFSRQDIDKLYICELCKCMFLISQNHRLSYFVGLNAVSYWPENMPTCDEVIIKSIIE